MIKAILFDLDNTLIDFMKMKHECCSVAIDEMISAGLNTKKKKAIEELYNLYEKYGMEHKHIFDKLLKKLNGEVDQRLVAHGIVAYRKMRKGYLTPYPNVISTLLKLKRKYKLAIVSDAPRKMAWIRLVTMKIDDYFDVVITKGDVKKQKTYATPYRIALKKLNIKPQEALMVGDIIARDIKTPKKLGIKTCYARYGDEKPVKKGKSGADFEIDDIKELVEIVREFEL